MTRRPLRNRALVESVLAGARATASPAATSACPSAEDLAAFDRGAWDYERARGLLRHVLDCDACSMHLPEDRDHPDAVVLDCYLANRIGAGEDGNALRARVAAHLVTCASCRTRTERPSASRVALAVPATDESTRATLLAFLLDLSAIGALATRRRSAERSALASRGGRGVPRSAARVVVAHVYDRDGNLVVDVEARPRTVSFEVERAEFDDRRGIVLLVSTTDRGLVDAAGPPVTVRASLRSAGHVIDLPSAALQFRGTGSAYPSATASFRSRTGVATGRYVVPIDVIEISVMLS